MPIKHFELVGNWNGKRKLGYTDADIGILTNQKAVDKIHRIFSKTEHNFKFYFVRKSGMKEFQELGSVSPIKIDQAGLDIEHDDNAITVVFNGNFGTGRIPMTAWIIAHRFSHAAMSGTFGPTMGSANEYLRTLEGFGRRMMRAYGIPYNSYMEERKGHLAVIKNVGTMRCIRQNTLTRPGEFCHEMVAQHILTGSIKLNNPGERLATKTTYAWGRKNVRYARASYNLDDITQIINQSKDAFEYAIDSMIDDCYGKVLFL